jgi:hypothetical protein
MYVDASYLPDYGTNFDNRRSTSGHCAILAGACTAHRSYRQDTLATSTTESEYIAAFEATREVRRQRIQLAFLGLPQLLPITPLYEDNESAIRIVTAGNGDSSSKRRQHIDAITHTQRYTSPTSYSHSFTLKLFSPPLHLALSCASTSHRGPTTGACPRARGSACVSRGVLQW